MKRINARILVALIILLIILTSTDKQLKSQDNCPNSARDITAELPVTYNNLFAGLACV